MKVTVEQLLAEAPQVDGYYRVAPTGWVRLTVIDDNGTLWIADTLKEHLYRRPANTGNVS